MIEPDCFKATCATKDCQDRSAQLFSVQLHVDFSALGFKPLGWGGDIQVHFARSVEQALALELRDLPCNSDFRRRAQQLS